MAVCDKSFLNYESLRINHVQFYNTLYLSSANFIYNKNVISNIELKKFLFCFALK